MFNLCIPAIQFNIVFTTLLQYYAESHFIINYDTHNYNICKNINYKIVCFHTLL